MKSSLIIAVLLIGIVLSEKNDKFPDIINSEPWLYWQRLGVFHHKLPKRANMESIVIRQRIKQKLLRMKIAKMLGQVKKLNGKTKTNSKHEPKSKSPRFNKFNRFHNKAWWIKVFIKNKNIKKLEFYISISNWYCIGVALRVSQLRGLKRTSQSELEAEAI